MTVGFEGRADGVALVAFWWRFLACRLIVVVFVVENLPQGQKKVLDLASRLTVIVLPTQDRAGTND